MDFMNGLILLQLEIARKTKRRQAAEWSLSSPAPRPRWRWLAGGRTD